MSIININIFIKHCVTNCLKFKVSLKKSRQDVHREYFRDFSLAETYEIYIHAHYVHSAHSEIPCLLVNIESKTTRTWNTACLFTF